MIRKIVSFIWLFTALPIFAQYSNESLVRYLKNSEEIVLTSHDDLRLTIEKPGKSKTTVRTLLNNEKPNRKVIKKQIALDAQQKKELIDLISAQKKDKIWDGAYCFEPHHALFIYNEKKWSYIDLCFGCDHYNFSRDLQVDRDSFLVTYEDWRKLETFFRKLNITDYLPERQ